MQRQMRNNNQMQQRSNSRRRSTRQQASAPGGNGNAQPGPIPAVHSSADLHSLLEQYGAILTPENKGFITELLGYLEQGGNQNNLMDLAARMQQAAGKTRK